jgi:hypothetical protein
MQIFSVSRSPFHACHAKGVVARIQYAGECFKKVVKYTGWRGYEDSNWPGFAGVKI